MRSISDDATIPVDSAPLRGGATASVLARLMLAVLDSSAWQIALPRMAGELDISPASSVWILISFQTTLVACLLPCSALGDSLGYRRVFLGGGVIFLLASLACAIARDMTDLCVARALQGVGAAAIYGTNPSLIRLIFPGRRLATGIALCSITNALSIAGGPSIGAALYTIGGWRSIFLVNLPIAALALCVGLLSLPPASRQRLASLAEALDGVSIAASIVFLPLLILGLDRLPLDPIAGTGLAVAGACVGAILLRRQKGRAYQIVPLHLLRQSTFLSSLFCSSLAFMALSASYVALPFFLEAGTEGGLRDAALAMMIPPLFTALANGLVLPLIRRFGEIRLASVGMATMALGLLALASGAGGADMAIALALLGLGFGIYQTPNNRMILGAGAADRSGNVSGTLAVARTLGQTLGATVVSLALAFGPHTGGRHALAIAGGAALVSGGLGLLRLRRSRDS
jgi:DHA2 family multidrug resistance protein-like MFS transporter